MFLTKRFFIATAAVILTIAAGYVWDPLFHTGRWLLLLLMAATGADSYWLWRRHGIQAWRECADRFSNGDANKVVLHIESSYKRQVIAEVIDEAPAEFQQRDLCFRDNLLDSNGSSLTTPYFLTPVKRGEYEFGRIRVFISTRLGLVQRRYTCGEPKHIKVYPSFLMLRQYELMAISNNLREMGVKRIRRIGHNTDFEQIKDYVPGDDYRTINWKATARRHQLMTNVYQEERSQQVFCVIDKGRMMQQAFQGMTLLDYAINASLVLSYIAIGKDDKAGLATFNQEFDSFVPASRQPGQVQRLLETLYNEQTSFGESDFSALTVHLNKLISKRSLVILYTSFTGKDSLQRQLACLRQLNRRHRLLVVFFEDVELRDFIARNASPSPTSPASGLRTSPTTEEYYQQVIAEKFAYEHRLIVQTLRRYGIQSLLTTPDRLTVNVINKYLDIKLRF